MSDKYWAAEPDPKRFARLIKEHRMSYDSATQTTRRIELWRRASALYWGSDPDTAMQSQAITFAGNQGEYATVRGNVFRALIRQLHVMTTGSRPAFQARPISYDATTTEMVTIANAWCDRILNDHVENSLSFAALFALIYGEGWIAGTWDEGRGKVIGIDPMTGNPIRDGEYRAEVFRPDQIVRDYDVENDDHDWLGVLRQHSRWSLVKRFPQHERAIMQATEVHSTSLFRNLGIGTSPGTNVPERETGNLSKSDRVVVCEFYHRPTDALPQGRTSWVIGDTLLVDGPNLYGEIPVYSMVSSKEPTGAFGYGEAWDLMGPQQAYDSTFTQMVSVKENFGTRNVWLGPGADADPENIAGGYRAWRGATPPQVVDLETDAVIQCQNALQSYVSIMQMLTGLNDAALGDAGKSSSGAALQMQNQLAAQFNSGLQRSYAGLMEKVMTGALRCLHTFGSTEMAIHVVGKNRDGIVKRFKAEDMSAIDGVRVELANPAMRSVPGRIGIADQFLAQQVVSPEQYLDMVATGRLEPATEGPRIIEAQVERENEQLIKGQPVEVLSTDNHAEHIRRHAVIYDDPAFRSNIQLRSAADQHLLAHTQTWAHLSMDPMGVSILAATGQQPSPAAAMMAAQAAAAMPQPGAPQGPQMPPNGGPPGPAPTNVPQPSPDAGVMPGGGGPDMPKQTHAQATPMA